MFVIFPLIKSLRPPSVAKLSSFTLTIRFAIPSPIGLGVGVAAGDSVGVGSGEVIGVGAGVGEGKTVWLD